MPTTTGDATLQRAIVCTFGSAFFEDPSAPGTVNELLLYEISIHVCESKSQWSGDVLSVAPVHHLVLECMGHHSLQYQTEVTCASTTRLRVYTALHTLVRGQNQGDAVRSTYHCGDLPQWCILHAFSGGLIKLKRTFLDEISNHFKVSIEWRRFAALLLVAEW